MNTDELQDGGPAFPTVAGNIVYSNGMSLRDWFAGQALAGICAHPDTWGLQASEMGAMTYRIADAVLAARAK